LLYGDHAGTKLYHNYYNLPYKGLVGITKKRGTIKAEYIIHARIDKFKNPNESINNLKTVLSQIFKCAEDKNLRRISIPAVCNYRGF
jgi:O-acetyl-ADP-ribose deacetylase (regulator of RNase III)